MAETLRDAAKLLYLSFREVLPRSRRCLEEYREWARQIPNEELRKQALASMGSKQFHADGGSVYVLLAPEWMDPMARLIVAYQTISDYLDNLCDRSKSLDPVDFLHLHTAMTDALNPQADPWSREYYRYREDQDDAGYLCRLVTECQQIVRSFPSYHLVQDDITKWMQLYSELQTHKHVKLEEREERLLHWWQTHQSLAPDLYWWEFAAATGSTLGVFVLCALATRPDLTARKVEQIASCYFPWMSAIHILLDYLIDQEEDVLGGDLNFVTYYSDEQHLVERMEWIIDQTRSHLSRLPDPSFHLLVVQGLLGLYLSDPKARTLTTAKTLRKRCKKYGRVARFFALGSRMYRWVRMVK
jgi:tetraprenyl-beta-curcumene synthase